MNAINEMNNWITIQFGGNKKKKWNTLSHNGVLFPPEYIKHGIPVNYDGLDVELDIESEEYATIYAKYITTEYINNPIFKKNFWNDWKIILGKSHQIQSLDKCNFQKIYDYLMEQKEIKKNKDDDEKNKQKEFEEKYKIAIVDGKEQPVGNFRIEPPGIFIGRGCNPKLGKIKKRIYPEDIIINIGKEAQIPKPLSGHQWGDVIHDKTVEWLASWKDDITGKIKYVWLGVSSDFKAKSDLKKFDLARKLKRKIKTIQEINNKNLSNNTEYLRQIATALYFIDNFALRVGNEKGDDEADTVGVTSLRVEHIELLDNNTVNLDFLGKDSVRFNRKLVVDPQVYKNLKEFIQKKSKDSDLFDKINSNDINKYLQLLMPKLTAKVFRTYNASKLFQKELKKITTKYKDYEESDKINILLDEFNKANAKVALLCNHQKNINKNNNKQIEKINETIKKAKAHLRKARKSSKRSVEKIEKLKDKIKKLKLKKELKIELKNVSLGTSKVNYIDPRITVAFMKNNNIPMDKIFSKALQEKFKWAIDSVDLDFKW